MNATELSVFVKTATYVDLEAQVEPLMESLLSNRVTGYDWDDLRQELLIVLWKCQSLYRSSKGSFLNLFIVSARRRLAELSRNANLRVPVAELECRSCWAKRPNAPKGGLCACGCTRWRAIGNPNLLVSMDSSGFAGSVVAVDFARGLGGRGGVAPSAEDVFMSFEGLKAPIMRVDELY